MTYAMTFLAPGRLWLIVVPAALAVAYVVLATMRRATTVRFTNLDLLASVAPKRPGWRRHLPAAVLVGALALLAIGYARPTEEKRVAKDRGTVVLAIDTSLSMSATDVSPDRLDAAKVAAKRFVDKLPARLQIALIAYSGTPRVAVSPTDDHDAVTRAIDQLSLGPGTATGEAIFAALETIASAQADGPSSPSTGATTSTTSPPTAGPKNASGPPPAVVVVMSDGKTTVGRDDDVAAAAAAAAKVPVNTIAFGTADGTVETSEGQVAVPVDKDALRAIADTTKGRFFEAASGDELNAVYDSIGNTVGYDVEQREVTAVFTGFGFALAALAALGSLVWLSRMP
jgi:Ca-activated chloride channel family protein